MLHSFIAQHRGCLILVIIQREPDATWIKAHQIDKKFKRCFRQHIISPKSIWDSEVPHSALRRSCGVKHRKKNNEAPWGFPLQGKRSEGPPTPVVRLKPSRPGQHVVSAGTCPTPEAHPFSPGTGGRGRALGERWRGVPGGDGGHTHGEVRGCGGPWTRSTKVGGGEPPEGSPGLRIPAWGWGVKQRPLA